MAALTFTSDVGHQEMADQVRAEVFRRTNGSIRSLEVMIDEQTVVLTGKTSRYYYKQLATSAVLELPAVAGFEIRNEITVVSIR